jgi:hypothetical protein
MYAVDPGENWADQPQGSRLQVIYSKHDEEARVSAPSAAHRGDHQFTEPNTTADRRSNVEARRSSAGLHSNGEVGSS